MWQYGFTSYPWSFQDFGLNPNPASVTGSADVIGWGQWMVGQVMQNQVGGWKPWNDNVFTDLGELYIIPSSGVSAGTSDEWPNGQPTLASAQFVAPKAGLYHVSGRFYGLAHDTVNYGYCTINKGEYDNSDNQSIYPHVLLHDDDIEGAVDSIARGSDLPELGPKPESFFDFYVTLDDVVNPNDPHSVTPLLFNVGYWWQDNPNNPNPGVESRFGMDVSIDYIPEPSSLMLAFAGGLLLVGFAIRRRRTG
jgi:hypothetical protein